MNREQLEKMPLTWLRDRAAEQGIPGAQEMEREPLIAALDRPRGLVARAREKVVEAAHRVEETAQALASKLRHVGPSTTPPAMQDAAPPTSAPPAADSERAIAAPAEGAAKPSGRARFGRGSLDIPSSTLHPHTDELETLTMARLYAAEGQIERALEILERLSALDPADATLAAECRALSARRAAPGPSAAAPPVSRTPSEPISMLDFEELPETYGIDDCEVLYKDPYWVFAYWEVTEAGLKTAREGLGQSADAARLVLRLFTTVTQGEDVERLIEDIHLEWNHGRRYLQVPRPGAHLRIAVGLLSPEGYFSPIAHSSLVRIPPVDPAPPGPVEWMEVVPARLRGREHESLVIVQRGHRHAERGVTGARDARWTEPTSSSAAPERPGSRSGSGR